MAILTGKTPENLPGHVLQSHTPTHSMAELGRYPLLLEIIVNMFKYLIHLLNSDNHLLSEAFAEMKTLKNSWYSCIEQLSHYLEFDLKNILKFKSNIKTYILNKLKPKYNKIWKEEVFNDNRTKQYGNKLRTYRTFKGNF